MCGDVAFGAAFALAPGVEGFSAFVGFVEDCPASEVCSGFDFGVFVGCEVGPLFLSVFFDELFAA